MNILYKIYTLPNVDLVVYAEQLLLKNRRALMYNVCACRVTIVVKVPSAAAAWRVSEY